MRKFVILALCVFAVYIITRLCFSYTLFNVPYMFGTKTYVGGAKYDFPICFINPLKIYQLKNNLLEGIKKDSPQTNIEDFSDFFKDLKNISDFDIISINTDENSTTSFLLRLDENPKKECVVFVFNEKPKVTRVVI